MNESDFFVEFMEKQYNEAFWDSILQVVGVLTLGLYKLARLSGIQQENRWISIYGECYKGYRAPVSGVIFMKNPPTSMATDSPTATGIPHLNIEQGNLVAQPPKLSASRPLSPDKESLYPLDSQCVSYILIQLKNLESYTGSYYQSREKYCFCNPLGCGLETDADVQDKRPYAALAMTFDRNKYKGPIVHKMNNTFVPRRSQR